VKIRLHLVRTAAPAGAIADHDWVVQLDRLALADHGTPPMPPGPIDHDQLVTLVFAAGQVVTW